MAQYTAEFLAAARSGYEATDQPMRELAREFGIGITTLSTLAEKHGWAKRSLRKRGLPPAMQLLAEAQTLAANAAAPAHSRESGNPESDQQHSEERLDPRLSGDERSMLPHTGRLSFAAEGSECAGAASAPDPANLLSKLEQILTQLIAAQQLAPANGIHSQQGARTLTMLIQSLRALQGLRGPTLVTTEITDDDDDMPEDIDEFRLDLARRIDAFVASRTHAGDDGEHSAPAPLETHGE